MSSNLEKNKATRRRNSFGKAQEGFNAINECSMCGDVGIENELFQCQRCCHRLQHRYCSKLYPRTVLKEWICDWCLHEREISSSCSGAGLNNGDNIERPTSRLQLPCIEIKQSPEDRNCKERPAPSTQIFEAVSADSFEPNCCKDSAKSRQMKRRVGRKEKNIKHHRYRYKSLAQLL